MLLGMYERHGRWDDYMLLAGSPRFLNALADQARRGGSAGAAEPLRTLDTALQHAITLGRVQDMAALLLARARWTQRLAIRTPLDALRAGSLDDARRLAGDPRGERAVLWYLLLAWELHDSGDIGDARQVLGDLVRGEPQLLASSRDGDWAVILLQHALATDEDNCGSLLRLLDDNALTDLARQLTEAGSLGQARTVAMAIRLFTGNKVSALAEIAIRQAEAGDQPGVEATISLAVGVIAGAGDEEEEEAAAEADQETDRGWRARALVDLASGPAGGELADSLVRQAIDDVGDVTVQAVLLAELGVTRDGEQRTRLLEEAIALAGQAPQAERWEVLASIGHIQGEAGLDGAAETFAAARRAVLVDYDPWASHRELHELCRLQQRAGDAAGARDTIAVALAGPEPDPDRWLVPFSLVGIAAAEGVAPESAGQILQLATQAAQDLRGEQRREVTGAIARAQAIVGDFDAAENTVFGLLPRESGVEDGELDGEYRDEQDEASGYDDEEGFEEDEDDDDDGSLILAAVQAGTAVARELIAAGSRDRAARLLRRLAQVTARRLADHLAFRDLIAELASAQADAGAVQDALETVALDWTPAASAAALGVRALGEAHAGDVARAVDTARAIVPLPWRVQALAGIAREVTGAPDKEMIASALADAASEASGTDSGADPSVLAGALAVAAATQAAIGYEDAARHSLAKAADLAARIPSWDDQARQLAGIVRSWITIGDHDQALRVARGIPQPWYQGEAMTAAIAAASRAGKLTEAREAAALIDEPGWHAVALVTVALHSRGDGESPLDLAEVQRLVDQVAEGSPRTRVWQQIIDLFVEHGRYALAADLTESMSADPGTQLARIVRKLAAEGAGDAIAAMLLRCARYPESAHGGCMALARTHPDHALDIAAIVVRSSAW